MKTIAVLILACIAAPVAAAEAKLPRNFTPVVVTHGKPIVVAQRRQCTTTCDSYPPYTCRTTCY